MRAFDVAVGSMKLAELAEFTIHSDYAYGPRGATINNVEIPPDEELTMEVSWRHGKIHYIKTNAWNDLHTDWTNKNGYGRPYWQ